MLDYMELEPEAIMVIHVGGAYGDRRAGCDNWVKTWKTLSEPVQRRMVLENDDIRFSAAGRVVDPRAHRRQVCLRLPAPLVHEPRRPANGADA